jgi:hypothetical protein
LFLLLIHLFLYAGYYMATLEAALQHVINLGEEYAASASGAKERVQRASGSGPGAVAINV